MHDIYFQTHTNMFTAKITYKKLSAKIMYKKLSAKITVHTIAKITINTAKYMYVISQAIQIPFLISVDWSLALQIL